MAADRHVGAEPDVLVIGAGPTGLATALQAHIHGARVRIVERRPDALRPSRALLVHPSTLEGLRRLGVTDELLERADTAPRVQIHLGRARIPARLGDLALHDTAFPHLTLLRQMDVEEVLADALRRRGVHVERGVELVDVAVTGEVACATLRHFDRVEEVVCRYVAGCDGPTSTIRERAGIGWRGGRYREEVVLADAELDGDLTPGTLHAVPAGPQGLVFVFALGERATWRILATRVGSDGTTPYGQPGPEVPAAELQQILDDAGLPAAVTELRWSTRISLQHRLATAFRRGPLLLAGDAAHAHSPAAGQGMNTGILDALNLGWKVALARCSADAGVLVDSYERERRPVARKVLALTHMLFFAEASTTPPGAFLRGSLLPLAAPVVPLALRQRWLLAAVVRMLSQRWVRYRASPLSVQGTPGGPGPRPGDRLPDTTVTVGERRVGLHDLTAGPGVTVLLARDAALVAERPLGRWVTVHRIASWRGEGLVAVRPDGYVGFRSGNADPGQLRFWLRRVGAC